MIRVTREQTASVQRGAKRGEQIVVLRDEDGSRSMVSVCEDITRIEVHPPQRDGLSAKTSRFRVKNYKVFRKSANLDVEDGHQVFRVVPRIDWQTTGCVEPEVIREGRLFDGIVDAMEREGARRATIEIKRIRIGASVDRFVMVRAEGIAVKA